MPTHNFALLPTDPELSARFTDIAQRYFTDIYDEYILGDQALPHITLAQFTAQNDEEAIAAYSNFSNKKDLEAEIETYALTLSQNRNLWAEFSVRKEKKLLSLQKTVFNYLKDIGLSPEQPPETYHPHVTLARVTEEPSFIPTMDEIPAPHFYNFKLTVGRSSQIGVYLKTLVT